MSEEQHGSYGSNSYSNYDFGKTAGTNSYGSYDYGAGAKQTGGQGYRQTGTGSPYSSGAGRYSAGGSNPYSRNSQYGNPGSSTGNSPYGSRNSQYGNPGSSAYNNGYYQYGGRNTGGSPYSKGPSSPGNKKKHTLRGVLIGILAAVLVLGIAAGGFYFFSVRNKPGRIPGAVADSDISTPAPEDVQAVADSDAKTPADQDNVAGASPQVIAMDVSGVYKKVIPSIVSVDNNFTESGSFFGQTISQEGVATGSGIIIGKSDKELLIATNNHVIDGAESLSVHFVNEKEVKANVKGADPDNDLAVIAVSLSEIDGDTLNAITIATLGNSDELVAGEPAIVIGNALGYGQSITTGVISSPSRQLEDEDGTSGEYIQTDAAINPGNSGGALLNGKGEVVGITTSKLASVEVEGMGYAIPISLAKPIIGDMMNMETREVVAEEERGFLGIKGIGVTTGMAASYGLPMGVYVDSVIDGGGAQQAGIASGDVITSLDGKEITSMEGLQGELRYYKAGTTVPVTVIRTASDGSQEEMRFDVTLSSKA